MYKTQALLSNKYITYAVGLGLIYAVIDLLMPLSYTTVYNSFIITLLVYSSCVIILPRVTKFLLVDKSLYVLPVMLSLYSLAIITIVLFRIEYSRPTLIYGFSTVLIWLLISARFNRQAAILKLQAIDNFTLSSFNHNQHIDIESIVPPYNLAQIKDGLVVNLHKPLTAEQEKFIADCSINNKVVYHSETIKEMIEGKVQTTHLSENALNALNTNPSYWLIKRVIETVLILLSLPVFLPIMLFVSIAIKLESKGPVFYTQKRIGQGGKPFQIYKLRSMEVGCPKADSKFATEEHTRVTHIGRLIRKTRIDEIPQFVNVLKGEMALIGPRPEQESFVKAFEQEIPFYGYRHMVKPGITGWAQTVQGYTADTDTTREKLAHDLYYIKHLSFWLDVNIFFKTLKTMLTGFGAK
ncbi:sugar transferase [Psychromonas sp. B3M02]|uniref:sugar transferase n=1 Tax=Psychromonas sp. B3M02 TaxID=2267226 RepID=UPI00215D691F|nr:sugar transferase [Psychromonas sp. B3M02]